MSNPTMELLRVILIIGILLAIGALIDGYRAKRSPGPRVPNKLNRRDLLWLLIVIMVLILLGVPWGMLAPPRSDNRPVPISDR